MFLQFLSFYFILMPGGRARGNPVQIFSENLQNFPSTDLKNILYFDIPMNPSFICHTKFGHSPHGLDFGIFGPLCVMLLEHSVEK